MDIQRLRYFVTAAELMHISQAALRLGISQPTLSQQIRVLESELGVALFTREHRRISLTPAGEVLLDRGRAILAALRDAEEAARQTVGEVSGTLRIGYLQSAVPSHPGQIITALQERYPYVTPTLIRVGTAQRLQGLQDGTLDAAFLRMTRLEEPGVAFQPLHREPLVLALSVDHPFAGRRMVELAELDGEDLAFFFRAQNPDFYDEVHAVIRAAGVKVRTVHEAWDHISLLPAVASGEAISLVARTMASVLHYTGVVYRDIAPPGPMTGIGFAARECSDNQALHALCRVVDDIVRQNGWPDPPLPLPIDR